MLFDIIRKTLSVILLFSIFLMPPSASARVEKPDYVKSTGFFMLDGKIYDGNGNEFMMRGVNHTHTWGDGNNNFKAIDEIAKTWANTVRVNFSNWDWQTISDTPQKRRNIVQKYIENRIVPMVELHEATCGDDPLQIETIVENWIDNKSWLNEFEEYVILNIANEWGPADNMPNYEIFRDTYKDAITALRANGINNMIVIDAPGCGQNPRGLEIFGQNLIDHDPQHNVVLSIHFYGNWRTRDDYLGVAGTNSETGPWGVENELKSMRDHGLPIIAGEFGWSEFEASPYDTELIIKFCHENNIGWLAWSWNSNSDPLLDMVYGWKYESEDDLRDYGKLIINQPFYGLRATSVLATTFGNSNQQPQVALTSPSAEDQIEMGSNLTLTATANDPDGEVVKVSFFRDAKLLGELSDSPYSIEWKNVPRGYHPLIISARDDSSQIKSTEPVVITVGKREKRYQGLFVVGDTLLSPGDAKVRERLDLLGFQLHIADDEVISADQSDGMDLVLISATVSPTRIKDILTPVSAPVICWEYRLFDDLGMTGTKSATDFGSEDATNIRILDESHFLAAGLSGEIAVNEELYDISWGVPGGQSIKVAALSGNDNASVIFAFESGAEMVSGNAPARRVGLFLYNESGTLLTDDGWRLFDAAVDWAIADPTSVDSNEGNVPLAFDLEQNYPNPFNPVTRISFTLPERSKVKLSVFDVLGKNVATLVNSVETAGKHSVLFDGFQLSSGIYFCKLETDFGNLSRRMVLMR